jgi:cation/acetate symporter
MTDSGLQGACRPSRRLLLSSLILWGVLAFVLPLAALTLNAFKIAGFPLGFLTTAVLVLVLLAAVGTLFALRAGGDDRGEGVAPSLRLAGEAIGSAGVVGAVGIIAAFGYDGLVFPLGVAAGFTLLTIAVAPRFALYPVRGVSGFIAVRYGGRWPRRVALVILFLSSIVLLAADLRGGALAVQGILATDYATGLAMTAVALGVIWLIRSVFEIPRGRGEIFAILLILVFIPVFALPAYEGRLPLPLFAFGYGMQDLATLEQKMIIGKLANFQALRPMAAPFLRLSMTNFAGFVLALSLGVAALPHLIGRHLSRAHVVPGAVAKRAALGTVWVVWFLLALAAFAVFERLGVAEVLAKGIETAAIPGSLLEASGRGWVSLCGVHSASAADVAAACAKMPGSRGFLRLQDVGFSSDGFALAAPGISGLPVYFFWPLWVAAGLAALVTGHAIVAGLLVADREGRRTGLGDPEALDVRSIALAVAVLFLSLMAALVSGLEIPQLFSDGLALVASGLFPVLVLGLFWRRMSGQGAVAAMLTGLTISGAYILGSRSFPVQMFEWVGHWSEAAPGASARFANLKAAYEAATTADQSAAWAQLWQHAAGIANVWGLKPAAVVLFAVPAAVVAGVAFSMLFQQRPEPPEGAAGG